MFAVEFGLFGVVLSLAVVLVSLFVSSKGTLEMSLNHHDRDFTPAPEPDPMEATFPAGFQF